MSNILRKQIAPGVEVVVNARPNAVDFALRVTGLDQRRPSDVQTTTGVAPEVIALLLAHDWTPVKPEQG